METNIIISAMLKAMLSSEREENKPSNSEHKMMLNLALSEGSDTSLYTADRKDFGLGKEIAGHLLLLSRIS